MFRVVALSTVIFLAAATSTLADDNSVELPSLGGSQPVGWQDVSSQMASQEYGEAVRNNKRAILGAARSYVEGQLKYMGLTQEGVRYTGATIGFLLEGARYHLNKSKTVALEVREVVENNRAMYLRYKLGW
jgi:hypothetical protein